MEKARQGRTTEFVQPTFNDKTIECALDDKGMKSKKINNKSINKTLKTQNTQQIKTQLLTHRQL